MKTLPCAIAIGLLSIASSAFAGAIDIDSSIRSQSLYFTGTCTDCSGTVSARLDLTSTYTFGNTLQDSDIIDFVYDGSDLVSAFTLDHNIALQAAASIPTNFTSGPLALDLFGSTPQQAFWEFRTGNDGTWVLGRPSDLGTSGTWSTTQSSATPEPASLVLFGSAVAVLTIGRRRLTR